MIKYASPFVPLADKTGLHEQYRINVQAPHAQKKFESEYVHPILGKLNPTSTSYIMGKEVKT
jgi:hypothetical protein